MGLLQALGLPVSSVREAAGRARQHPISTVTLHNRTGSVLRLLGAQLTADTARFVTQPPGRIDAGEQAVFTVAASSRDAANTAGFARYHLERKKQLVDVKFSWGHGTTKVDTAGDDARFTSRVQLREDSEKGNTYLLLVHENVDNSGPRMLIRLANRSGATITRVSMTLQDSEHCEFGVVPKGQIAADKLIDFMVQPLDDDENPCAGSVEYRIESTQRPPLVKMSWRRAAAPEARIVPDDGRFVVALHRSNDNEVGFVVKLRGGPPPEPVGPARITIVNRAGFALTDPQASLDSAQARFHPEPPERVEGNSKGAFGVESLDPEFPVTGGFVRYRLRLDPPDAANPSGEHELLLTWLDGGSMARITPESRSCNVRNAGDQAKGFVFVVTGPALVFDPPAKARQPTLRKGDQSADGWVEYLQEALNHHLNAGLVVNGQFDSRTLKAVQSFQRKFKKEGVLEDGIVGDQTWSYLREGVPEKPATDKRKPHTYVESGTEARWVAEKGMLRYDAGRDAMVMNAISVGDVSAIEGRVARIRIVAPDGRQKVLDRPLLKGQQSSTTGQGWQHDVAVLRFSTLFDEAAPEGPPPGDYLVSAYLPGDLGGDSYAGVLTVAANGPSIGPDS